MPVRRAIMTALLAGLAMAPAAASAQAPEDKALGRPAISSSVEQARPDGTCTDTLCAAGMATDGRDDTRWASAFSDTEWWVVDLGRARQVDSVALTWHQARAQRYLIQTSLDGVSFAPAASVVLALSDAQIADLNANLHWTETTAFPVRTARYVRVMSLERAPVVLDGQTLRFGVSLWTASVFGPPDDVPDTPESPPPDVLPATVAPPPATPASRPPVRGIIRPFPLVRLKGRLTRSGARIDLLRVRSPRSATIRVRCRGRSCPERVRRRAGGRRRIGELQRALRAGTVVTVLVTRPGDYGKYTRFVIRRGRPPARTDRCLSGMARRPVPCPA